MAETAVQGGGAPAPSPVPLPAAGGNRSIPSIGPPAAFGDRGLFIPAVSDSPGRLREEGAPFRQPRFVARGLYNVMVKYVAPVLIGAVLISEICRNLGLFGWSI